MSILKEKKNEIDAHDNVHALIGIHDQFEEEDWVTIFSENLISAGYSEWAVIDGKEGPSNSGGIEHCGALIAHSTTMGLNDVSCHGKYAFFCERWI